MRRTVLALGFASALSVTAFARAARAADGDVKKVCIDADTQGQSLRRAGKLVDARAALKACLDPRCPDIVRTDCNERMDELSRVQPTLVIVATDGKGGDLSAVQVFVDGTKVADALGGERLPIDPGPHDLRFETAGAAPVTRHLIVHEGDPSRREVVAFGGGPQPVINTNTTVTTTVATQTPPAEEDPGHGRRVAGVALGIGGIAVLATGVVFGLVAKSEWNSAQADCGPACAAGSTGQTERTHALTFADVSTVGYILGPALVAGGAVLYFTAPKKSDSAATASAGDAQITLAPTLGGAVLRGSF